jgi:hypothetical protein
MEVKVRALAALALLGTAGLIPLAPRHNQLDVRLEEAAVQPLPEAILGRWSGVLIVNDKRRNFTRVRAHFRFTGAVVYFDREELDLGFHYFPGVRDWRADYEVVGSSVYMNPHRPGGQPYIYPVAVVLEGVTVAGESLEAVTQGVPWGGVADNAFGPSEAAAAIRMQRE